MFYGIAFNLLGRHVERRSHDHSGTRHAGNIRFQRPREAEVGNVDADQREARGGITELHVRAALRRLVFADVAARRRLEAILHPLIRAEAERQVRGWRGAYGIVVVPLLLEHEGLRSIIDRILVVDCPEEEQVRRVVARSGLNVKEVRAIMATQLDRARRRASADDILDNSGTISAIAPQVQLLDQRYRELAAAQARG